MAAKKTITKKVVKKAPVALAKGVTAPKAALAVLPHREPATARSYGSKAGLSGTAAERQKAAKAVMAKINKSFDSEVIVTADQVHSNAWLRRPSGVMQLDIDTGGGLPAGTFNTLTGPDGAGKTTLLYMYFAMHQRLYGNDSYCALAAVEGGIDYFQARRVGWIIPIPMEVIDARQRELKERNQPQLTKEEVADLRREIGHNHIIRGLSTAEEYLDVLESLLLSNVYGMAGLDSYEALMPKSEAGLNSLEEFPVQAARASVIGRFLQHYGPITRNKENFTTFIMTCQVRYNRKKAEAQAHIAKYLKDWSGVVPPSVKHWRQYDVQVWSGGKITNGSKEKEGKVTLGKDVNWEITKAKLGGHDHVIGDAAYYYDERGFDCLRTVLITGIKYGVIKESDSGLTFIQNGAPHEYLDEVPNADLFTNALQEDAGLGLEVRREILAAAGVQGSYI